MSRLVITMSKKESFLANNAFIRKDVFEEVAENEQNKTIVSFEKPLDKKDAEYYANISVDELKRLLIRHFLTKIL